MSVRVIAEYDGGADGGLDAQITRAAGREMGDTGCMMVAPFTRDIVFQCADEAEADTLKTQIDQSQVEGVRTRIVADSTLVVVSSEILPEPETQTFNLRLPGHSPTELSNLILMAQTLTDVWGTEWDCSRTPGHPNMDQAVANCRMALRSYYEKFIPDALGAGGTLGEVDKQALWGGLWGNEPQEDKG
jgi:hypothetical protein